MSKAVKISTAVAAFFMAVSPVHARPDSPEDKAYIDNITVYGKTMVSAKYAARFCPARIRYNDKYFANEPPIMMSPDDYNALIEKVMTETKTKLDRQRLRLGDSQFCNTFIDFIDANYDRNFQPIVVTK